MKIKYHPQSFREFQIEWLQDPENVHAYLAVVLEEYCIDHDLEALLYSLHVIAEAQGEALLLVQRSEVDQESFDKILSENPNLGWNSILEALGYMLSAVTLEHAPSF